MTLPLRQTTTVVSIPFNGIGKDVAPAGNCTPPGGGQVVPTSSPFDSTVKTEVSAKSSTVTTTTSAPNDANVTTFSVLAPVKSASTVFIVGTDGLPVGAGLGSIDGVSVAGGEGTELGRVVGVVLDASVGEELPVGATVDGDTTGDSDG